MLSMSWPSSLFAKIYADSGGFQWGCVMEMLRRRLNYAAMGELIEAGKGKSRRVGGVKILEGF